MKWPCLLGTVIALAVASTASAAPPRDPPKDSGGEDVARAKQHYQQGTRAYDVGLYERALAEYEKAYVAKPDPALLYNIGQCHRKLGRVDRALDAYRSFLRRAPKSARRADVERLIAELEQSAADSANKAPAAPPTPAPVPAPPAAVPPPSAAPQPSPMPAADPVPARAAVDLSASSVSSVSTAEPETTSRRGPWLWVAGAVAVAGGVVAVLLATRSTERRFRCPECDAVRGVPDR